MLGTSCHCQSVIYDGMLGTECTLGTLSSYRVEKIHFIEHTTYSPSPVNLLNIPTNKNLVPIITTKH